MITSPADRSDEEEAPRASPKKAITRAAKEKKTGRIIETP
jgi:hypothetical protein